MGTFTYSVEKGFNPNADDTLDKLLRTQAGNVSVPCQIVARAQTPGLSDYLEWRNFNATLITIAKSGVKNVTTAFLIKDLTANGTDGCSLQFYTYLQDTLSPNSLNFSNPALGYVLWQGDVNGSVYGSPTAQATRGFSFTGSARYPVSQATLSIDISSVPVFDNESLMNLYLSAPTDLTAKNALNYKSVTPEEPNDFFIYSQNIGQEIDAFGNVSRETSVTYRDVRFVLPQGNKAVFYFKENKEQRYDVYLRVQGNPTAVEYSTDGLTFLSSVEIPWFDFCYKTPHYAPDGLRYKAIFWQTNIPLFLDETSAQEYLDGTKGIEDSYNYNELTDNADKSVNIGQVVEDMTVNATSARGMFCSRYALGLSNIAEITDKLFTNDENVMGAVIEGLKFYGQEPMQCVIDLTYYPFDITQYGNTSPQQYIYFGNYKLDLDASVDKIVNMGIVIDCGETTMPITYNDYRDYEPYTEMYVYLPYCNLHKLNIASYIGKTISVKYGVDITTGACSAFIFANNKLVDTFTGSMGVRQFITSMDSAEYASNILNAVAGGAGDTASGGAMTLKSLSAQTVGGFAGGLTLGAGGLAIGMGKGLHNLKNAVENVPFSTRGSTTSMLGQYAPQYPYFVFAYATTYTSDILGIVGKPTNASGKLYNFSGFLQCADVKLTSRATDEEKREIVSMLQNGIYI